MKAFEQFLSPKMVAGRKIDMLFRLMSKFGYRSNTTGLLNLNIIGIRTLDQTPNVFNDWLAIWYYAKYQYSGGVMIERPFFHLYQITTDPGLYYLKNPLLLKGTMILKEGQYPVYSLDLHRGKYLALCQRRGPVTVYRDRNKDEVLDFDPQTVESGDSFGCNIHRAGKFTVFQWIDKFSAGCQVFKYPNQFDTFIMLCQQHKENWGNKFTYTLLNEKDFGMLD